ncbi:MAG: DUF5069 domain-containing protein [Nitrospinae bacterium]|nr:DUF5069 domain-containing protein [Nitrospinota bacterium]
MDLYREVRRSSKETMAGLSHLPRMIDKARALRNSTLGEYIYPCPLDRHVLNFLETDPKDFADLAEANDDGQMAEWAEAAGGSRTGKERDLLNAKILDGKPDAATMAEFLDQRNQIDPTHTDVITWADLRDLEEGHI